MGLVLLRRYSIVWSFSEQSSGVDLTRPKRMCIWTFAKKKFIH